MRRKLRLLICSPAGISKHHGVGMVLHHHVLGFLRRGHEVQFLTSQNNAAAITISDYPGLSVKGFDIVDQHKPFHRFEGDWGKCQDYLSAYDGDVIISHMNGGWTSDLLASAERRTPAKRVTVGHGYHRVPLHLVSAGYSFGLSTWAWRMWRAHTLAQNLRPFDHLVFLADCPFKDKGFYDLWVARRNGLCYSVIPNGVEVPVVVAGRGELARSLGFGDRPYILSVSNYVEGKNQEEVLECFLAADTHGHDLVFMGSAVTGHQAELKRLLNRKRECLQGRRVFVLDHVPRDLVCAAFRHAAMFLLMSVREAQPMVILEAMASGVPFVSLDVGCVKGLRGGVVVRGRRHGVEAINRILGDSEYRAALATTAVQEVKERYNWPTVLDAYERLFYELVGAGGRL